MASFTTPVSNAGTVQENTFPVKPAIALALAALADWLFYGQRIEISLLPSRLPWRAVHCSPTSPG